MENGVQLYCITHKEYPNLPDTSLVHPLLVGMADVPNIYLKTRDFVPGLSKMNGNWNELEGLYYIRYNCDAEIKGQYQYSRRILLTSTQIIELLSNHIFISGYSRLEPYTIQTQYCISHHIEDLVLCGEIIKSMYPELYDAGWNLSMNSNIMLAGNCFIARAKDYDAYQNGIDNNLQFTVYAVGNALKKDGSNFDSGYDEENIVEAISDLLRSDISDRSFFVPCVIALGLICDTRYEKSRLSTELYKQVHHLLDSLESYSYRGYGTFGSLRCRDIALKMLDGTMLTADEERFLLEKIEVA